MKDLLVWNYMFDQILWYIIYSFKSTKQFINLSISFLLFLKSVLAVDGWCVYGRGGSGRVGGSNTVGGEAAALPINEQNV